MRTETFVAPGQDSWFQYDESVEQSWISHNHGEKQLPNKSAFHPLKYERLFQGEVIREWKNGIAYGSVDRTKMMHMLSDNRSAHSMYTNNEIALCEKWHQAPLAHDERYTTPPLFFVFADKPLSPKALASLRNVHFHK